MSVSVDSDSGAPRALKVVEDSEVVEAVVIRFSGDSGDGMQLTGNQFTNTSAIVGNDIATFPDYPAEIRAPAGTTFGVSGFQINFASKDIFTPAASCTKSPPTFAGCRKGNDATKAAWWGAHGGDD